MLLYIVTVRIRSKRRLLRKAIDWTRAKEQVTRRSSNLVQLNPKRRVKERNIVSYRARTKVHVLVLFVLFRVKSILLVLYT